MKQIYFLCLVILFISKPSLHAQESEPEQYKVTPLAQFTGNFTLAQPMEAFNRNLNVTGLGFGGLAVVGLGDLPIYVGLEGKVVHFQRESIEIPFEIDGFITDAEYTAASNAFLGHAVLRFQPTLDFPLRPYIDALVGAKNFYLRTKIEDLLADDELIESSTESSSWGFSYGGAIGIQIPVTSDRNGSIDIRAAYLPGAPASYLVLDRENTPVNPNNPIDFFEEKRSPTALLLIELGFTYEIVKVE